MNHHEVFKATFGDERVHFRIHESATNGDCLFDSLRLILHSMGLNYSAYYLRSVAARAILNPDDKLTRATLHSWHELYQAGAKAKEPIAREYAFMRAALHHSWPLPESVIEQISSAMMDPDLYWGEQNALRLFEKQLQIRFLIFELVDDPREKIRGVRLHSPLDHSESPDYQPTHYMMLYLYHRHYKPVSYQNTFCFQPTALPAVVQNIMKTSASEQGWVSVHPTK